MGCSCSEGTTGERLENQHVSVPCCWLPRKTVPRSRCTFVGTSQVCAAILVPAPCPGEVSSTWITPACVSMTAALVQSFMLWHQFSLLLPSPLKAQSIPYKTSLLLPKGISSSLRLSSHLTSQLQVPPCALWACGCAPHTFTPHIPVHPSMQVPACC